MGIERNNKPLSKCTDDEIEAEAARRRSARIKNKHKLKFCDECAHFRIWDSDKEIPEDELMRVCTLGHQTRFILPEYPDDEDWGFYRTPCPDREIALNRKSPWQIREEKAKKQEQRMEDLSRKLKHKEWNQKLEARKKTK